MDLEISCDELRHRYAAPQRSRRVPEDPQQKVDRHKTGILGSSHGKGFALPSLPSDCRSVSRAFWATGALSKTPVFRNHLDILIYFRDFYNAAPPDQVCLLRRHAAQPPDVPDMGGIERVEKAKRHRKGWDKDLVRTE